MNRLLQRLGIELPIIQAPMAGISTPALAAAVSNAGALGSVSVGAVDASRAQRMIEETRALTARAFNVNLFCHRPAVADDAREAAWLRHLTPLFASMGAAPPRALSEIYQSFVTDDAMLAMLLEQKPRVVSFHFGLPSKARITALREAGIVLLACATSLGEARAVEEAGIDAVVAQGYEAGGHRGVFDPAARDDALGTLALTRILVARLDVPVIAAGGIMDGAGIAAALALGASAAQLGTAFVACPESSADDAFRAALSDLRELVSCGSHDLGDADARTVMTRAISGRPARALVNALTAIGEAPDLPPIPDYPIAYDAAKALAAAARTHGRPGFATQLAGQGVTLARALPAAALVEALRAELAHALAEALVV